MNKYAEKHIVIEMIETLVANNTKVELIEILRKYSVAFQGRQINGMTKPVLAALIMESYLECKKPSKTPTAPHTNPYNKTGVFIGKCLGWAWILTMLWVLLFDL